MAGLFGMPYEGDPTGALLGQNYNSQVEQEQKLWGLLEGAGYALLNPTKGSGDLGALANAFSGGAKRMGEAGTSYLATAYERKKAQDDLRHKQKEEDDQLALERDAVSWMKQFDPKTQEMINGNPQMAKDYWDAFLKERAAASGAGGGFSKQPLYYYDPKTDSWQYGQLSEGGGVQMVPTPEGLKPAGPGEGGVRTKETGAYIELQTAATSAMNNAADAAPLIGSLMKDPNVKAWGTGMKGVALGNLPGTQAAGIKARIGQLRSLGFFAKIQELRGMGALSNIEGEVATNALIRAENSQSFEDFSAAMRDFDKAMKTIYQRNYDMIQTGNFDEMNKIRQENSKARKYETGADPDDPFGVF